MPEWLDAAAFTTEQTPPLSTIIVRVVLALLGGFLTAALYRITLGRGRRDVRSLPTTLVLLSLLIAVVTVVIGNNIARAFGLVGALSIVRFRTVVDDTADTAFVIFSVTLGMAIGSGYLVLATVAFPAMAIGAFVMLRYDTTRKLQTQATLVVKFGLGLDADAALKPAFDQYTASRHVCGAATAGKGTAVEVTYRVQLIRQNEMLNFIAALNKVDGVSSAELR